MSTDSTVEYMGLNIQETVWKRHLNQFSQVPLYFDYKNKLILYEYCKIFNKYLPKTPRLKALEVGCGAGLWLGYFHKIFGYDVYGIDISETAIKLAELNLSHRKCKYNLTKENIFNYNKNHYYKFVYSFGLFEHFNNPNILLNKCDSLLKRGGYLMIEIPHYSKLNTHILRLLNSNKRYKRIIKHQNFSILTLSKFKKFINTSLRDKYEYLYLDVAGLFDLAPYFIKFDNIKTRDKIEWLIFKFRKLIQFLNIKEIGPGLIFIGRKK